MSGAEAYTRNIEERAEQERRRILNAAPPGPYDGLAYRMDAADLLRSASRAVSPAFELDHVGSLLGAPTPIPWLVPGILARDTLVLVSGPPKSLKSFWTDGLANAVGTGARFDGITTTTAPVVTVCGEGRHGIGRRKMAWQIRNGMDLTTAPVYVSRTAARMCEPVAALEVEQAVQRIADATGQAPGLIVVDTLQRNMGAGDENSTADVSRLILHLDRHLREPFRACVLVVHHTGHTATDRARGSSVLPASADVAFQVARSSELVTVSATFAKDWQAPEPMTYRMELVELPWLGEDGNPETSCVLRRVDERPVTAAPTGHAAKALAVLREMLVEYQGNLIRGGQSPTGARVKIEDWRNRCGFEHRSQFTRGARDVLLALNMIRIDGLFVEPLQ